jgi:hypothetical protein
LSRPDPAAEIGLIPEHRRFGRITGVTGMLLEMGGLPRRLGVGGHCAVLAQAFLAQGKSERADLGSGYAQLAALLEAPW